MGRLSAKERMERAEAALRERTHDPEVVDPAEFVSRVAADVEATETVAQNLSRAFAQAMNATTSSNGFTSLTFPGSIQWEVECQFNFERFQYLLTFSRARYGAWQVAGRFVVDDEALARNTQSTTLFNSWVFAVAHHIRTVITPPAPTPEARMEQVRVALNTLVAYGVREAQATLSFDEAKPFQWEPTPEELEREEQRAIESIWKVMGDAGNA